MMANVVHGLQLPVPCQPTSLVDGSILNVVESDFLHVFVQFRSLLFRVAYVWLTLKEKKKTNKQINKKLKEHIKKERKYFPTFCSRRGSIRDYIPCFSVAFGPDFLLNGC